MNLVHFDLLPWPAPLTHIKTDFRSFQYKAFRYSIFCRLFFFFFFSPKIKKVGISTWHLVRSLIKTTKKSHCIGYIFCSHSQSPSVLQNDVYTLLVLLGVGPSALHSALNINLKGHNMQVLQCTQSPSQYLSCVWLNLVESSSKSMYHYCSIHAGLWCLKCVKIHLFNYL